MKGARDRVALVTRYQAVQDPILREARDCFSPSAVQSLRAVVRLAVEFDDYLRREDGESLDADELEYVSGSVFGGIGSFVAVADTYKVLVGSLHSTIQPAALPALVSAAALKESYLQMYQVFEGLDVETRFLEKVRLVLDLFKLQLVFVSVHYDW